jgi:hypothetical protein
MKISKLPSPTRLVLASLGAFWLAGTMHPGFNSIGILILLLIPVLIFETLFPKKELKERLIQTLSTSDEKAISTEMVSKKG